MVKARKLRQAKRNETNGKTAKNSAKKNETNGKSQKVETS